VLSSQASREAGGVRGTGEAGLGGPADMSVSAVIIYSDWASAAERPADTDDGAL